MGIGMNDRKNNYFVRNSAGGTAPLFFFGWWGVRWWLSKYISEEKNIE